LKNGGEEGKFSGKEKEDAMSAIENLASMTNTVTERIFNSEALTVITIVAITALAALMFSLSAWANVKLAAMYGSQAILKHSIYTTILPLAIVVLSVGTFAFLVNRWALRPPAAAGIAFGPHRPAVTTNSLEIASPMPGRIITLNCKVGDYVREGDALCMIEFMKMNSVIRAHERGKIAEILVQSGAIVDWRQPIIRIEKTS
jgi:multidrug efflux pump subunit AcrA (membrane-fusion protein)